MFTILYLEGKIGHPNIHNILFTKFNDSLTEAMVEMKLVYLCLRCVPDDSQSDLINYTDKE